MRIDHPAPALTERACEVLHEMRALYTRKAPTVSFEFFPPKTEESEKALWETINTLSPLKPNFVSVTYGAGGSTRERTHATIVRLLRETLLRPAAHLTCIGATKAEIDTIARIYWEAGVRHIVALRGDLPETMQAPTGPCYGFADELVAGLKRIADFNISVAAYPEMHPQARSADDDIDHLKRKLDAGATRAISQFFFEVDVYLRFVERARARGISAEIIPGILPVTNVAQLKKFAAMCGTNVPGWLAHLFDDLDAKPELRLLTSAMVAAEQCRMLMLAGVTNFHFYTLNRADLTQAICHMLGVRAEQGA